MRKTVTITISGVDFFQVAGFMRFLKEATLIIGGKEESLRLNVITEIATRQQGENSYEVSFKINTDFKGYPSTTPAANSLFMGILNRVMDVFNDPM